MHHLRHMVDDQVGFSRAKRHPHAAAQVVSTERALAQIVRHSHGVRLIRGVSVLVDIEKRGAIRGFALATLMDDGTRRYNRMTMSNSHIKDGTVVSELPHVRNGCRPKVQMNGYYWHTNPSVRERDGRKTERALALGFRAMRIPDWVVTYPDFFRLWLIGFISNYQIAGTDISRFDPIPPTITPDPDTMVGSTAKDTLADD
jgi:hypothetical protein